MYYDFSFHLPNSTVLKRKVVEHLSPLCSDQCLHGMADGKLQCSCGDTGAYDWGWDDQGDACVVIDRPKNEIIFHPVYSSGTAAARGAQPFKRNMHYYWEMKMLSHLYGTDVMVGVGTSKLTVEDWRFRFFSLLGSDDNTWGFSYNGKVQHNNLSRNYGSKFGLGSLIGVHLDMCTGTLEFYLNRKPQGIAFTGLKQVELYPMVSSTAAHSAMKTTCAISVQPTLQLQCLQCIVKSPKLFEQFKNDPGMFRIYEKKFFWLLYNHSEAESDESKRKMELKRTASGSKKRKLLLPVEWPRGFGGQYPRRSIQVTFHGIRLLGNENCDSGNASKDN